MSWREDRLHNLLHAVRARLAPGRDAWRELVFVARHPLHEVYFQSVQRHLPGARTVMYPSEEMREFAAARGLAFDSDPGFPRAAVYSDFSWLYKFIPRVEKLMMFHGVAEKNYTYCELNRVFDWLLVHGPYMESKFRALGYRNTVRVGFPKLDPLFDGSIDRARVLASLGLPDPPPKPVLLYAPTWGPISSLHTIGRELHRLAEDFTVVAKLHPGANFLSGFGENIAWAEYYRDEPRVTLATDFHDITPYFAIADVLLGDYSSVTWEFAVLNRPIVLADVPLANWAKTGWYHPENIENKWRDVGLRGETIEQIHAACVRHLEHPELCEERRRHYAAQLFDRYEEGGAALRTARFMAERYQLELVEG